MDITIKNQLKRINKIMYEIEQSSTHSVTILRAKLYSGDIELLKEKGIIVEPIKIVIDLYCISSNIIEQLEPIKYNCADLLKKIYKAKTSKHTIHYIKSEYSKETITLLESFHIPYRIVSYNLYKSD